MKFSINEFFSKCHQIRSRGGSLTNRMLIIAFYLCLTEGHLEIRNEVGSLSPVELLVRFEAGTFFTMP